MRIEKAERLKDLAPYLFAEIDKAKRKAQQTGRDIIDLGVGDPDQPTPRHIVDKLYEAAQNPAHQHYALDAGMPDLRTAIAQWFSQRFQVRLEPDTEILPLIGSKEGLAHLPLALINPGEIVLIPEPSYPPYRSASIFAQGQPVYLPLRAENAFLPELSKIKLSTLKNAKLLFLNYPNNPTTATAEKEFFAEVIKFAQKHRVVVAQDAAYSELAFDGYRASSILQVPGAKDVAVEFHSFSKTYNMSGWRIGWISGQREVISALAQVKSNIDSGIFPAIQLAAIAALKTNPDELRNLVKLYQERRDLLCAGLNSLGWKVAKPQATFYLWTKLPSGQKSSIKFAQLLLEQADVVVTPGVGFGASGEGYIRIALTVAKERLKEAVARIKKII